MRLKGKVAIVTGGGPGIGRATAQLFAKEGAKVVVADFNADLEYQTVQVIRGADGEASFVQVDVSDSNQVQHMVEAVLSTYGGNDILRNGADVLAFGTALDTDEEDMEPGVIDQLDGGVCMLQGSTPTHDQTGRWLDPQRVVLHRSARCKGQYRGLCCFQGRREHYLPKAMAVDRARVNVRVNAIAPGPTDSHAGEGFSPSETEKFAATFPMGRLGRPEELANAALFLASDESSFVTGSVIAVDDGQSAGV